MEKGHGSVIVDELLWFGILTELSVGSKILPCFYGWAIVGNVVGSNDGVIGVASVVEEAVDESGSIKKSCSALHVPVGAEFEATGHGLAFSMEKVSVKVGPSTDDTGSPETNEVPVA